MKDLHRFRMFGGKFAQLMAAFAATVNAISDGMSYGWASPVIPILKQPDSPVQITEADVVWLESTYMIGGIIGLPITIYIVDKFGRKNSILMACVTNLIHWTIMAFTHNIVMVYVARLLTGLAGDVAFVSAPMYIAECADQRIRGFLASIIYIMMLVGILVVYSVAPFVSIPVSSAVGALFLIVQLLTLPFMPESPYYLLLKGKPEKAKRSMQFLRATDDVDKELTEIKQAVARQNTERGSWKDLFTVKSNRKAFIIMAVLNGSQHFSSISVLLMNMQTILEDAASILEARVAAILFAATMLVAAMVSSRFLDKAGRKLLLTLSSLLTGLSLAVLATYFAVKAHGIDVTPVNWIPVAAVMVYAVVFKIGLGLVPIVLTAELFPTSVKAIGMTCSDAMYVSFSCVSIYLYQFLSDAYGRHVPFFLFSACCVATGAFALLYIPETKGKTLEEIQFILKGRSYIAEQQEHGTHRVSHASESSSTVSGEHQQTSKL